MLPPQRNLKWVRGAEPEEIDAALASGELDFLLAGREADEPVDERINDADQRMKANET